MYLKIKSVAADLFLIWFLLSTLLLSGCGPHMWKGAGQDMVNFGEWVGRVNHEKIQKQAHGLHVDQYEAYSPPIHVRLRRAFVAGK